MTCTGCADVDVRHGTWLVLIDAPKGGRPALFLCLFKLFYLVFLRFYSSNCRIIFTAVLAIASNRSILLEDFSRNIPFDNSNKRGYNSIIQAMYFQFSYRLVSSVGEHFLDREGVVGSSPSQVIRK